MPETYNAQIVPPEGPTYVDQSVEINEETTNEEVVQKCSDIVTANVGNLLYRKINLIDKRLQALALMDEGIFTNKIEELKAALIQVYQELKFATYDYEYGLTDDEDQLKANVSLPGENIAQLNAFKAITWVLEKADQALVWSHGDVEELESVIRESQNRLADLDQFNDREKEKATLQGTIDSREERLKPKKKRHAALVFAINGMLMSAPKDMASLTQSMEKLLTFMVANGWLKPETTMQSGRNPEGVDQEFPIEKLIDIMQEVVERAVKEAVPAPPQRQKRVYRRAGSPLRSQQRFDGATTQPPQSFNDMLIKNKSKYLILVGALAATGFFGIASQLYERSKQKIDANWPHFMHENEQTYNSRDNYYSVNFKTHCVSAALGLENEDDYTALRIENSRRIVEAILKIKKPIYEEDIEKSNSKKKASTFLSMKGLPASSILLIKDLKQEILKKEFVATLPSGNKNHPNKIYEMTVKRTATVELTFSGGVTGVHEVPVETQVTYKAKFKGDKELEPKHQPKRLRRVFRLDERSNHLKYKIENGKGGSATITITRKDGKALNFGRKK